MPESIGHAKGSRGTETSQYPDEKESNERPQVVASERGSRPNRARETWQRGCRTITSGRITAMRSVRTTHQRRCQSCSNTGSHHDVFLSTTGPAKSCGKLGGPPSKAKYLVRPIAHEYREGTVKSTPARGMKETLKPCPSKPSEGVQSLMACLL
jgi:hypothetical protein